MRILCIAGTPIDITTIHSPQIGDNIDVVLHYVTREICIENTWVKDGLHYSNVTTTFTSW
jgi:hypothetical protein